MTLNQSPADLSVKLTEQARQRQSYLGLFARTPSSVLLEKLAELEPIPTYQWLKKPETGMVMVKARIGGDGAPFHAGEMTMTRCVLRMNEKIAGVGYVRGSDHQHAEAIALLDALAQSADYREHILQHLIPALQAAEQRSHTQQAAATAQSKVDFFTLVRGENT